MLNEELEPVQDTLRLLNAGVMVISEVIGVEPTFVPWITGMVFDPDAAKPVFWLLLIHA